MRAVVHHGGSGTTAAATRAGVAQLVVPHVADQFHFGALTHKLGIGVAPLRRTRLRDDTLAARIEQLISDPRFTERAQQVDETIRARPRLRNASRLLRVREPSQVRVPQPARISVAPGG